MGSTPVAASLEPERRRWHAAVEISTALEVLDTLAHVADEGFESTHGGTHRKRGTSNATRWGNGLSDQAKHASAIYVRIRRMIGQVRAGASGKLSKRVLT